MNFRSFNIAASKKARVRNVTNYAMQNNCTRSSNAKHFKWRVATAKLVNRLPFSEDEILFYWFDLSQTIGQQYRAGTRNTLFFMPNI